MKTKEELNAIKEEVETVSKKACIDNALSDDELEKVAGGHWRVYVCIACGRELTGPTMPASCYYCGCTAILP